MTRKIILITGATGGIGKATAAALARQGHRVIIHGRDIGRTKAVCEALKQETGNSDIDFLTADLSLMSEVRKLADDFRNKYDRLDVLVNNAGGIYGKGRGLTAEGLEQTMALNLFAPFLLTGLLLDKLAQSRAARIINVSSAAHRFGGRPDLQDFQLQHSYTAMRAYGLAKLYLIWNTQYLARLLQQKGAGNITVNALHPGVVATGFGRDTNLGFLYNMAFRLARPLFTTPEKGAETSIYLAGDEAAAVTGRYFKRKKIAAADTRYHSPEHEQAVWTYCLAVTGLPESSFRK